MENELKKQIGNSLYLLCEDKSGRWYIEERYRAPEACAGGRIYYDDIKKALSVMKELTKERELARFAKGNAEEGKQKEKPAAKPQKEVHSLNEKSRKEKPMTVSPMQFKQMVFDIVMESQDQMTEDTANALLDIIGRFDIGSPWISMECGKPTFGEYFFIKLKESAGYTDLYWRKPILAKRVIGGFDVAGRPFADSEVEFYSVVRIPR